MSLTPSTSIPLGFNAPEFSLTDVISKQQKSYHTIKGTKATVVMFICNHCPFVVHVQEQLVKLANDYQSKGIGFVAISSNDVVAYPQDSPEKMVEFAANLSLPFAYLFDETQEVAQAYDAACTPDFSVFDGDDLCVYRGELDGSRPGNGIACDGKSMRSVLDLLIANKTVPVEGQRPSVGCNIKWK